MHIGPYKLDNKLILAPMAGVTDRPFRQLCKTLGAGMAVSEMVSSNSLLWGSVKTQKRIDHEGEIEPKSVQIAGSDPQLMARAAIYNHNHGAQIIDINMGCPAKKVCNVMAGSALLRDEAKVAKILKAVVSAVDIPVTLKIRTGWNTHSRNGVQIAILAEDCGISALSVHGRTRACAFKGNAEYDTIASIKQRISIPVIANGDIDSPDKAKFVLSYTNADAIMIGRAALGKPWIFREIDYFLKFNQYHKKVENNEVHEILHQHLLNLYSFYGEQTGLRIARKHISWYSKSQPNGAAFRNKINRVDDASQQLALVDDFFQSLANTEGQAA